MSQAAKRIHILNPLVAERIAAGEVIERPASVVKELVENSLDAGATEIAVILEDGGKALIEILDNGHGIHRDDLAVCLKRHATSKIARIEDLESLATLGFRGEALPSVAAVSDLSILSRTRDSETAHEIVVAENDIERARPAPVTFGHFLNSPHGTRIQARGLFAQIPARLKFLKSQSAEVAQVREWLERLALAHPRTGFRLVSDDRLVLNLRPATGDNAETDRVRAILSDGDDHPMVCASNDQAGRSGAKPGRDARDLGFRERGAGELHVRIHWLQGLSSPQARRIVQVVNGRSVRDRLLQQALLAPFRQALLPGQYPAVALFVEVDPAQIDVNVHPSKTEIRFLESRKIFHAVESLVESMIAKNGAPSYATSGFSLAPSSAAGAYAPQNPAWRASEPMPQTQQPLWSAPPTASMNTAAHSSPAGNSPASLSASGTTTATAHPEAFAAHPLSGGRFAGILFNTYLMYDLGQELVMVDQHAAHERIRFEKLRDRMQKQGEATLPASQSLLIPEAVHFQGEQRPVLEERLAWLESLGFEVEIFGEDTVLFRGVPGEWGTDDLRPRLKNLIERVLALEPKAGANLLVDENLFEALASEACHSAIRAGDRLEPEEAIALVDQLFRTVHPWNCPHGRPTVVRVPRGKLEEWFQRRV